MAWPAQDPEAWAELERTAIARQLRLNHDAALDGALQDIAFGCPKAYSALLEWSGGVTSEDEADHLSSKYG